MSHVCCYISTISCSRCVQSVLSWLLSWNRPQPWLWCKSSCSNDACWKTQLGSYYESQSVVRWVDEHLYPVSVQSALLIKCLVLTCNIYFLPVHVSRKVNAVTQNSFLSNSGCTLVFSYYSYCPLLCKDVNTKFDNSPLNTVGTRSESCGEAGSSFQFD